MILIFSRIHDRPWKVVIENDYQTCLDFSKSFIFNLDRLIVFGFLFRWILNIFIPLDLCPSCTCFLFSELFVVGAVSIFLYFH